MNKYLHDEHGKILQVFYGGDGCPPNMGIESEKSYPPEAAYVDQGDLYPIPASPEKGFVFNYQTKTWEDPRTLEDVKYVAYKKIEEWRDSEENKEFVFSHAGRSWDAGLITRQRLQPVVNLSQLPDGFFWTAADNVDVPMNMPSLQLLSQAHEEALVIKGFEIHAQQRAMKNAVAAATTKEQVESIVIGY